MQSRKLDKLGITVELLSADMRAQVPEPYKRGLIVSDVAVSGPSFHKLSSDGTILLEILNPGPRRVLRSPADLDAVLSGAKSGDLVSMMVYDMGPQGGITRVVTVKVQ